MSDRNNSSKENQGEGNKTADRNYREKTREFVESGKVEKAAEDAVNISAEELRASRQAEAEARKKARS